MHEEKSAGLFRASAEYIPGGVNSPVRAYRSVNRIPRFIDKARGSKIYDVDGNEYIDYVCSWGPAIMGHAHESVLKAVHDAVENGLSFGAPTEKELKLARLVNGIMPHIESLRLVNSGTEAVMSAIRLARGYTGKNRIIKFRGCYHGHSDAMLVKAGSGGITTGVPDSIGVPAAVVADTMIAEYNDIGSVERLFEAAGNEIAAVIVEPVAANMGVVPPAPGFLQALRDITSRNGTLLIFDEVITGFRIALGGASERYGVIPDLVTLGKIIGGGMPIGAYGGRREIMEMVSPSGKVYQAGTLAGNPVATAAGIATLSWLRDNRDIYAELEEKGAKIEEALKKRFGDSASVNRTGSLLSVFFTSGKVTDYDGATSSDTERFSRFFSYMLDNGVYLAPSQYEAWFISAAHSGEDIDKTCRLIEDYQEN
ncbi:MAG: glutamate-1-semialdehyde 2,1-aminomutase [Ruminobacter sp.]|jgi:glutamate-1-semialdehyde 2,1-aminomutase|uniref:glutamate-1-semialdehyde 2,1-aminomutase n=1 Tax=Ruminobacter sp. TaxID=2774296 RepID=UPI00257A1C2C|nr:glutamate-1-semialdehyde 2,1-aminomutase [Ruminobacter sp.]MBQ3776081.1 glutamate-1-semialdehyde 2,1-aminomutase [Ruminobacter sp.]